MERIHQTSCFVNPTKSPQLARRATGAMGRTKSAFMIPETVIIQPIYVLMINSIVAGVVCLPTDGNLTDSILKNATDLIEIPTEEQLLADVSTARWLIVGAPAAAIILGYDSSIEFVCSNRWLAFFICFSCEAAPVASYGH